MNKDLLVKRLMATFLEELQEHVQSLNRHLLALEKGADALERADRLKQLFRTFHSLKGAARSVSVPLLEEACHHLEEILAHWGDHPADMESETIRLLFAASDAFEEAGMRLREEQDLTGSALATLVARLASAAGQPQAPSAAISKEHAQASTGDGPAVSHPPVTTTGMEPAASATVRIAAEKLDRLLAHSGELLVARGCLPGRARELASLKEMVSRWRNDWQAVEKTALAFLQEKNGPGTDGSAPPKAVGVLGELGQRFRHLEKELERLIRTLAGDGRVLDQAAGALDLEVRQARMLPFTEVCQGLERLVHDLARSGGKEASLVIRGGEVELDRSVLDGLKDPLRHLVRNAVDHGIEPAEERRGARKPARGQVTVSAVLRAAQVEVVVADDGRGLNLEALRQAARRFHVPEPADEREAARLVFHPGLSTSARVTGVSGRGMGLDVVKSRVEALHGTVDLAFTPGRGTSFTLAVPLTLTTMRALLVSAGGQMFAFVGTNVHQLARVTPGEFRSVEGRDMLALGGVPLPAASLAETLGLAQGESSNLKGGRITNPSRAKVPVVILAAGARRLAFVVDELVAEQEILIKSLGARIRRLPHVAGATLLADGRIALVLNAASLIRTALGQMPHRPLVSSLQDPVTRPKKRLLIVEDSVTTRTLEKTILESAGYEVLTVGDGLEAWQILQERSADLLVSDIEMPRMDGFALTETVRSSPRFRALPVVLVTAHESDPDRARGLQAGANAYLVKSAFDQRNLLETIAQLL